MRRRRALQVEIVSRKTWRDRAISLGAGAIAVASFILSVWQGYLGRQHDRLSVRPILTMESDIGETSTPFGVTYKNCGAGPAILDDAFVYIDGRLVCEMDIGWWKATRHAAGISRAVPVDFEEAWKGRVIEVNASKVLLVWRNDPQVDPDPHGSRNEFVQLVKNRLGFQIGFHSVYGQRWRLCYSYGKSLIDEKAPGAAELNQ